jgi:hypothetical protein
VIVVECAVSPQKYSSAQVLRGLPGNQGNVFSMPVDVTGLEGASPGVDPDRPLEDDPIVEDDRGRMRTHAPAVESIEIDGRQLHHLDSLLAAY